MCEHLLDFQFRMHGQYLVVKIGQLYQYFIHKKVWSKFVVRWLVLNFR